MTNKFGGIFLDCGMFITGIATSLLGGVDTSIKTLLGLMIIDFITGIMKSAKKGILNSERGFIGIKRKATMILLIIATVLLDRLAGLNGSNISFRGLVISFYIGMEGISIVENAEALGVPVHSKIKEMFENFTTKK